MMKRQSQRSTRCSDCDSWRTFGTKFAVGCTLRRRCLCHFFAKSILRNHEQRGSPQKSAHSHPNEVMNTNPGNQSLVDQASGDNANHRASYDQRIEPFALAHVEEAASQCPDHQIANRPTDSEGIMRGKATTVVDVLLEPSPSAIRNSSSKMSAVIVLGNKRFKGMRCSRR